MSHYNYVYGVKIYTNISGTSKADIGLVSGVLQYSEVPLTGATGTWYSGFISSIGDISQKLDNQSGGGIVSSSNTSIKLLNTNQLSLRLKELGISLFGCKVEIYEFIGTDADADNQSGAIFSSGVVQDYNWDDRYIYVNVDTNFKHKRHATLSRKVDESKASEDTSGQYVQMSFGYNEKAQFQRTADIYEFLTNNDIFSADGWNPVTDNFPVAEKYEIDGLYTKFTILLGASTPSGGFAEVAPQDPMYVKVVDGDMSGQVRKIDKWKVASGQLTIWVTSIFEGGTLSNGLDGGTASWVKLLMRNGEYAADFWPCYGFVDGNGDVINVPDVYTHDTETGYSSLAPYVCNINQYVDENGLSVNPDLFTSNIENPASYFIKPVEGLALESAVDLTVWGYPTYQKVEDGLYDIDDGEEYVPTIVISGDIASCTDKNSGTQYELACYSDSDVWGEKIVITFKLPAIAKEFDFSAAYLGLWLNMSNKVSLEVKYRKWAGLSYVVSSIPAVGLNYDHYVRSIPDFYFENGYSSKNRYFYQDNDRAEVGVDGETGNRFLTSGYKRDFFELDGFTDIDKYSNAIEIALIFTPTPGYAFKIDIQELAIIFESSADIKNTVYSPHKGRIFNSTWGTRKTAADMIETPIDALEHVARLQNWSEAGATESAGNEYAASALIKTSDEGSFDDSSLDANGADHPIDSNGAVVWTPNDLTIARQIDNENEMASDVLIKSLCKQFYLVNYQDKSGYECISYLYKSGTPDVTVTLADVKSGDLTIEEPDIRNIFVQPKINYAYDYARKKYTKSLEILNVSKNVIDYDNLTDYINGFDADNVDNGALIWQKCHNLWRKYKQIETTPASISNCDWIKDYKGALWYLALLIDWMGKKRTKVTVSYLKGHDWYVGKHINLQIPHQTNNIAIKCLIEEVTWKKNSNTTDAKVVLMDEIPTSFYAGSYQDTVGASIKWQDTAGASTTYQDA